MVGDTEDIPGQRQANIPEFGRRSFIVGGIAALFASLVRGAWAAVSKPAADPFSALGSFLDTLLPADGNSPSATEIGLDRRVLAFAVRRPDYQRLLEIGCGWLDAEARKLGSDDFAALSPADRESIVARAATAPEGTPPYLLFGSLQQQAFDLYYSDPRSWPALGFDGPPQPVGFPDHDRPPE